MGKELTHNLHIHLETRRRLRYKTTPEERVLWKLLKSKQLNDTHWYRQFSVGCYILDFYCPSAKLCIELDGIQHYSEEAMKYDTKRTAYLAQQGIEVLRVPNELIWSQRSVVIDAIVAELEQRLKI